MVVNILIGFLTGTALTTIIGFILKKRKNSFLFQESENFLNKAKEEALSFKQDLIKSSRLTIKEERDQLEKEYRDRQNYLLQQEKQLTKKEVLLSQEEEKNKISSKNNIKTKEDLDRTLKEYENSTQELEKLKTEYSDKISHLAFMTKDQAKAELVSLMEEEAKVEASKKLQQIEEETKESSEKIAKKILAVSVQRFAAEYVAETTITTVELPSDEIKGRLIGREGRNIRAFEQICGVDLLIDDTPGLVVISSFNVTRREIARLTIQKLILDGRVHPARIEEFHERSLLEIEAKTKQLGERAQMEIGIHGLHPEILKAIGSLNWRTSYMQNQYQHSLEVAFLCGLMAAELKMNVKQARRAGLLHDIGKIMDASFEGSHAIVGADFAKKYGESPDIVHAIRAHHEDEKPQTVLAHLVIAADALSGARPGIRKAMMQSYVSRLGDIERIVNSFPGVERSYALSAGREVRVLVESGKVSDDQTLQLSKDIAKKIEQEMSYPGTIKISVIRETKAVGYAK
jgi:ribonuclease Y